MINRKSMLLAFGVGLLTVTTAVGSHALVDVSETNYLKFNRSVALPGVVLAPGAYTFELVMYSGGEYQLVRVSTRDRNHAVYTGFTRKVERPRGTATNAPVTFGEVRPGEPVPIVAWYPLDWANGYAFIYGER